MGAASRARGGGAHSPARPRARPQAPLRRRRRARPQALPEGRRAGLPPAAESGPSGK